MRYVVLWRYPSYLARALLYRFPKGIEGRSTFDTAFVMQEKRKMSTNSVLLKGMIGMYPEHQFNLGGTSKRPLEELREQTASPPIFVLLGVMPSPAFYPRAPERLRERWLQLRRIVPL